MEDQSLRWNKVFKTEAFVGEELAMSRRETHNTSGNNGWRQDSRSTNGAGSSVFQGFQTKSPSNDTAVLHRDGNIMESRQHRVQVVRKTISTTHVDDSRKPLKKQKIRDDFHVALTVDAHIVKNVPSADTPFRFSPVQFAGKSPEASTNTIKGATVQAEQSKQVHASQPNQHNIHNDYQPSYESMVIIKYMLVQLRMSCQDKEIVEHVRSTVATYCKIYRAGTPLYTHLPAVIFQHLMTILDASEVHRLYLLAKKKRSEEKQQSKTHARSTARVNPTQPGSSLDANPGRENGRQNPVSASLASMDYTQVGDTTLSDRIGSSNDEIVQPESTGAFENVSSNSRVAAAPGQNAAEMPATSKCPWNDTEAAIACGFRLACQGPIRDSLLWTIRRTALAFSTCDRQALWDELPLLSDTHYVQQTLWQNFQKRLESTRK